MEDNTQSDFLVFLIRDLSFRLQPKYRAISLKCFFFLLFVVLPFCLLVHHFIVRIGLPFYIFAYKLSVLIQIQWNLFLRDISIQGTPPFRGHKNWYRKNVHIIIASVSFIEETPLFRGKGHVFWVPKPWFDLHLGDTLAPKT